MNRLKRFLSFYKPHIRLFVLDMACTLFICAVDLTFPVLTQYILKTLLPAVKETPELIYTFVKLMVLAAAAYGLRTLFNYLVCYWGHVLGVRMEADIRRELFAHVQTLQFSFFDKVRTGKLLSRMTSDLNEITELAHHGPEEIMTSVVTIVGAFILMFIIEWRLALALAILMPIMIFAVMRSRISMQTASAEVREKMAEINADIESSISGARVAKAFTNEAHEQTKFERGNRNYVAARGRYYKTMAAFHTAVEMFAALFNLAIIAVGGWLIYKDNLDPVVLLTFSLYIASLVTPIRRLAAFAEQYVLGMAGFSRFCEVMELQPDITDAPDAVPLKNVRGDINFENVSFAYDGGSTVLKDINLTIPAGKTLALVGPSGGGKTTLCHLIPRFYEVRSGRITIDGKDIRTVTLESLRRNIGIVQQDVFLFADTVMENIRYGREDATDEEVMEAARRAHIHDEIIKLKDGYLTVVGERGITLSGGQKQRISIARLFLKNPPVLILDEATSALDTVTETDIQRSFNALSEGRTTLVIAHRLSTVQNADEIVVIDENGIRERGNHKQLMELGGEYARLYRATLME